MPITDVLIRDVVQTPTRLQDVDHFTVYVEPVDYSQPRALGLATVQTVNAWRASLCSQAKGQVVSVTWRDSRYGPELLDVQPAGSPQEAA